MNNCKESNKIVRVLIAGDLCPTYDQDVFIKEDKESLNCLYGDLLPVIGQVDIAIANLECPLTDSLGRINKIGPHLKASKKCINSVVKAGFNVLTLANNHIRDFGDDGIEDTLGVCKEKLINTVGAGLTGDQAEQTEYLDINGVLIALINVAENEWSSVNSEHGGSHGLDPANNVLKIKEALSRQADHVIVIVHSGVEHVSYPSPRTVELYRFFVQNGASLVVGHHPHCVQGYETYGSGYIFYSLGNFLFPPLPQGGSKKEWNKGFSVLFELDKHCILSVKFFPYYQFHGKRGLELLEKEELKKFLHYLESISLPIQNAARLEKEWQKQIMPLVSRYMWLISYGNSLLSKIMYFLCQKIGVLNILLNQSSKMMKLHLMRSESHRDVLIDGIKYSLKKQKKK